MAIVRTHYLRNLEFVRKPVVRTPKGGKTGVFAQLPIVLKLPGKGTEYRLHRHGMSQIAFVWVGTDMIEIITDDVEIGS